MLFLFSSLSGCIQDYLDMISDTVERFAVRFLLISKASDRRLAVTPPYHLAICSMKANLSLNFFDMCRINTGLSIQVFDERNDFL